MLNNKNKKILEFILVILILSVAAGYTAVGLREYALIRRKNVFIEKKILKFVKKRKDKDELINRKELLGIELGKGKQRFYYKGDIDPYKFGVRIKKLLVSNNLTIKKYQTVESKKNTALAFSVNGSALDFFRFLQSLSESAKYIIIPYISISTTGGNGKIGSLFRITYDTIDN